MTASPSPPMPGGSDPPLHEGREFASYRLFDTAVSSQIPLPELPAGRGGDPQIVLYLDQAGIAEADGFATCHEWRDSAGRLLCRGARRKDEYRLWLPGHASFHVGGGGVIRCTPAPGVEPGLLRHLLLNQVLPRVLAHWGELLLHASAVSLPNGKTVAFLGESGHGKSTLAYFCQQHGATIIDDDCILLRAQGRGVYVTGGAPTIRLYPDSLRALGHPPGAFAAYANDSNKQQMCLAATSATGPQPLHALFLLNPPGNAPAALHIDPAAGQAAMMAVLRSAFTLDPSDSGTMKRTFQSAALVLSRGLPVYQLRFPRQHAALPQVLQALLDHQ